MANVGNWTIIGDNPVAEALRDAARYVDAPTPIVLATQPIDLAPDAFAIGPTILVTAVERVVPYHMAYQAIAEIKRAIDAGEAGRMYGCFTSFRVPRGRDSERVAHDALLPAVAVTFDLLSTPVARVHATRASLFTNDDAWFVTLQFADGKIATIEGLATLDPAEGIDRDILVEVTASDRVLRAEPTRQSVVVERLGGPATLHPWWEDLNERFLKLVAQRVAQPPNNAGSHLRAIWNAIQESAESGQAVSI